MLSVTRSLDTPKLATVSSALTGPVGTPSILARSVKYPVPVELPVDTVPNPVTTPLSAIFSSSALKIGTIAPIGIVELPNVTLSVK